MAVEIKMPQLSQTTEDVRLIGWLVEEGQEVKKGDPLCEVETDKTTMAVESFESGTVLRLIADPDTMVVAGTLIAVLGRPGEKVEIKAEAVKEKFAEKTGPVRFDQAVQDNGERVKEEQAEKTGPEVGIQAGKITGKINDGIKATPLVRSFARKRNINLAHIRGSGPHGLITKNDIEEHAADTVQGAAEAVKISGEVRKVVALKEYPLSKNQVLVAKNLTRGAKEVPIYYLKCQVFTDSILAWREKNRHQDGIKVSVYSLLIKAAAGTLNHFPKINGFFRDNKLILFDGINVGFAVTAGDELYVPVIKNAYKKDIREIDREVKWLVAKAQDLKLEPQDIMGGTFTITNLGSFPIDEFCAIINPPQAGILAVGRMKKALYIDENDAMRIRKACTVTGSFDHRIVNGAQGAAFLEKFKKIIEEEIQQ